MVRLIFILIISLLYLSGDEPISKQYIDIFQMKKQQADANREKSIYAVIKPITVYTGYSIGNKNDIDSATTSYGLSYNQDIYKSGNIWRSITIAHMSNRLTHSQIDIEKRNLRYSIYSLALELKKSNLDILKQEKLLENAIISKNTKEDKYLQGLLDISELDDSIISVNNIENTINDLKLSKENILSSFNKIASKNYKDINIPHFNTPSLDEFINSNNVHNKRDTISILDKNIDLVVANYLPIINLNAQYGYSDKDTLVEISNTDYSISLRVSSNLNFATKYREVEQAKINMLVSKLEYEQSKKEENIFYDKLIKQLRLYDKKIELSMRSAHKYETLVEKIKDLQTHGIRTKNDVRVILNTKRIKEIESDIFKIKKQISIIEMYKHFKD